MKPRSTQFGVRENTASSRQHAPRLAVDSLPSMSETLPGGLQHRQPTQLLASRANEPDKSIITMPLEAATRGETRDSAETFSSPATVITAKESRQVTVAPEPFVSAQRRRSSSASSAVICWSSPAGASPEPIRLAREANGKSGCFASRNSPPPLCENENLDPKSAETVYDRIWQSPLKRGAMSYQRGSLKKVRRKEGETWVLRYRVPSADGRRVEHITPIGLVRKFPKDGTHGARWTGWES